MRIELDDFWHTDRAKNLPDRETLLARKNLTIRQAAAQRCSNDTQCGPGGHGGRTGHAYGRGNIRGRHVHVLAHLEAMKWWNGLQKLCRVPGRGLPVASVCFTF